MVANIKCEVKATVTSSQPCLGFPLRSNGFAFEPTVQVSSIFSLSGLTHFVRVVRTEIRSPQGEGTK